MSYESSALPPVCKPRRKTWSGIPIGAFLTLAACCFLPAARAQKNIDEPIKPLPLTIAVDAGKAELGRALFFDKRLARDDSVSCASCHAFDRGGAFPAAKPVGAGGKRHALNSPSIFNVAYNFRQLWSGGVDSVEAVVDRVIKSPVVFDSTWDAVIKKLAADKALEENFRKTYRDGLTAANAGNAIAEYSRSLVTPNARFDKYLRGDANAIDADEKAGYLLFKKYGCVACHQGVNVGGNMYQSFGVIGDYFHRRGDIKDADYGRFNFTRREEDRFVFKVPSLRNVALTAPYFHDGSAATLDDAVDVMFRVQLGRTAPQKDRALIVRFLGTLTGEAPSPPAGGR